MKKLSKREVIMLTCLGVVVVLAGYYLLVFQPLQIRLADTATELADTTLLLDAARAKESEGLEVKKNLAANQEIWDDINTRLPEGFRDTEIIDMMAAARTQHRIEDRLLSYRFGSTTPVRDNMLNAVNIEVTLTAEYNTVMSFIKTFMQNDKITCRITSYSSGISNDADLTLNRPITAKFTMQILYRIPLDERVVEEVPAA